MLKNQSWNSASALKQEHVRLAMQQKLHAPSSATFSVRPERLRLLARSHDSPQS